MNANLIKTARRAGWIINKCVGGYMVKTPPLYDEAEFYTPRALYGMLTACFEKPNEWKRMVKKFYKAFRRKSKQVINIEDDIGLDRRSVKGNNPWNWS